MQLDMATPVIPQDSIQVELDLDIGGHGHQGSITGLCRSKLPQLHLLQRLFIQAHAQRPRDLCVVDPAIRSNHHIEQYASLIFAPSGFVGKLGIGSIEQFRWSHSSTLPTTAWARSILIAHTATSVGANTARAACTV